MAVKRNGLGKGLDSLIPDKTNKTVKNGTSESTQKKEKKISDKLADIKESPSGEVFLKVNEVEPNRDQPRKEFDEKALEELSRSIEQHGIFTPLLVRKSIKGYDQIGRAHV